MPIWSEVLRELLIKDSDDWDIDFDRVRKNYLYELHLHTGRSVILYASGWLQKNFQSGDMIINDQDIHALMEVTHGIDNSELDLILHSPGGSVVAAEAIVSYLRCRFSHIRVIVPNLAMSAAAMISCAADEIVLGEHSFLGPTDPQIPIPTPQGKVVWAPAQAIVDEFNRAKLEMFGPVEDSAWFPILNQYWPSLMQQCIQARELSTDLVKKWLEQYMLKDEEDSRVREEKAKSIAKWFADHEFFKSHGRHISRQNLIERGLNVIPLEKDPKLQDLSLSIFHAVSPTFEGSLVVKIIENHDGKAYLI